MCEHPDGGRRSGRGCGQGSRDIEETGLNTGRGQGQSQGRGNGQAQFVDEDTQNLPLQQITSLVTNIDQCDEELGEPLNSNFDK